MRGPASLETDFSSLFHGLADRAARPESRFFPNGEDPEAVMLHLVQPAWPGGRGGDEGRAAGEDEIGRRVAPGDTPQHACM
jgi:hypothetical protein